MSKLKTCSEVDNNTAYATERDVESGSRPTADELQYFAPHFKEVGVTRYLYASGVATRALFTRRASSFPRLARPRPALSLRQLTFGLVTSLHLHKPTSPPHSFNKLCRLSAPPRTPAPRKQISHILNFSRDR
ncbi:hypothetical protein EVAR_83864_1 [Eumeta japonica]|uniref:Uncharacterized protein n=1 Tax=Eumeta variegata TaxID=151549 RepID=A0A4C1UR83_EUMVA|nr:hypothetical protein EVAR_83864_1 [Eumeta japonica]